MSDVDDTASTRDGVGAADTLSRLFLERLPVDGVSITVVTVRGNHATVAVSDPTARELERVQYELGEGPHWDALRDERRVLVPSADDAAGRWPALGIELDELGVRALFAFPMIMGAVTIGVVDLYRCAEGALRERDLATAVTLAASAAGAAVRLAISTAEDETSEETSAAPGMRREVHQATGMLTVQLDTSATDAFSRLRALAYSSGRDIQDVARDVIARTIDLRDSAQ